MSGFVKLGDLTHIRTGKLDANASSENGQYPFFTCSKEPLRIASYSYDCECVLVAGNGDLNVKYYDGKFDAYQRTYIIESADKRKLLVKYLYFFLDIYVEVLRTQSIGGVIKYIKLSNLTDALIPLPSIKRQAEIIECLEKCNTLIDTRQREIALIEQTVKSRFIELFGDPMTDVSKWSASTIGEQFNVSSGGTPATGEKAYWENGTIPWIGSNMCQDTMLSENDGKFITEEGYAHSSAKWFHKGTVLVALVGATIGKTALLRFDTTTNQNIAAIDVTQNAAFSSEFVFYHMQMLYSKFMEIGSGKFKMANQGFIRQLPLICPRLNCRSSSRPSSNRPTNQNFAAGGRWRHERCL